MGYKEQRLKIGERERETMNRDIRFGTETRNKEVRHGTEDGRQGTKK
jgi:hypothetical protein